ncbi:MAG TPA: hypothetical protein VKV73_05205 [Chloroflexota bacterium]|nr:hypothetical protein [Chloroflexota bacterium]
MQLDFGETPMTPEIDSVSATILVWADEWQVAEAIEASVSGAGHRVRRLEDDAELVTLHRREPLLVAQCGPRLEAQLAFLRGPIILVEAGRKASPALAARAYAVVADPAGAGHAVDRFVEHRQLARQVAERRGPPRRCSRCGRGFDARKARGVGTARRFVRFGSISLCGTCVEALRRLLRQAQAQVAVVEADQ